MMSIARALSLLEEIERHYDAEFDINPGGPEVHWSVMSLVRVINKLIEENRSLEERIKRLEESNE